MRIGELARRTGVGVSALRAWELRLGLLEPRRTAGGQRWYSEADVERVLTVRRLLAEGLTLPTAVARVRGADGAALPAGEAETLLLHRIVQNVNQGIWVAREGRSRYANRRMAELLRCSLDDLLAASIFDFVDDEHVPLIKEKIALLRQGVRHLYEVPIRCADGSAFLAEVNVTPIHDRAGRYEGGVALVNDITDRKKADAQARFRAALLEAVGEAVVAATPDGTITYLNPAAERAFGWPAAEVLGQDQFAFPTAIESAALLTDVQASVVSGRSYSGDLPMVRRDGSRFVGHLTAAPVVGAEGEVIGLIGVMRDISDRLKLDQALRMRELEEATVALLGARALARGRDAAGIDDAVVRESVEAVRRVLEVERSALIDVAADGALAVRVASPRGGHPAVLPPGSRSLAGYTALAHAVVVVDEVSRERRFEVGPVAPETRSAIGAPVFGPAGVRAVLTVESSAPHAFDNAAHFVQGIANVVGAALR